MYSNLNCDALVVGVPFTKTLQLAEEYGFEAVSPKLEYLADLTDAGLAELRSEMGDRGLRWGAAAIGVDPGGSDAQVELELAQLRRDATVMERAGVDRTVRYLWPTSDDLAFEQNFELHAGRIASMASILADHGIRLGLEYVGPRTLWATGAHPFVRTLRQTQDLIAAAGATNLGLCLDTFHWYTAGETTAELLKLVPADVVSVDVNDAVAGVGVGEQVDGQRELPGATGVIDVGGFVAALRDIGYDGPVQVEPFKAALRELAPDEAVARASAALKAVLG